MTKAAIAIFLLSTLLLLGKGNNFLSAMVDTSAQGQNSHKNSRFCTPGESLLMPCPPNVCRGGWFGR